MAKVKFDAYFLRDGFVIPQQYKDRCKRVFKDDKVTITVEHAQSPRSLSQNNYYWGVVVPAIMCGIEEAYGRSFTKSEVHLFLRQEIASRELINPVNGKVVRIAQSSTQDTQEQFSSYIDMCMAWASEYLNVAFN